jgi:hypothetical protein
MATLQEIIALRNQTNQPLMQLGNVAANVYGTYKQNQRQDSAEANKLEAIKFLKASSEAQAPEEAEALFMQAYAIAPELIQGFTSAQKARREAMGGSESKPITDYQKASIELRREQLDLDKLKAQQAKASSDLKREQLQVAIDAKKAKLQENEMAVKDSAAKDVATFDSTLSTIDQLINHEGLESAVGTSSIFPTIAGSEAANFEAKLEQLKGQQFLTEVTKMKGMGALSENEGKKIAAAAAALDLGMSEEAFREELNYIQKTMQKARNKIAGSLPKEDNKSNQTVQKVDQLSDDELLKSLGL